MRFFNYHEWDEMRFFQLLRTRRDAFFQLLRTRRPIVHVVAGIVPLAWIHIANTDSFFALPNIGLTLLCALVSLLPDIDTRSSVIGRFIPEVSRYIEQHYGHRTITHSLAANLLVGAFAYLLATDWLALTLAYTSHLVVDMIEGGKSGVPLLWPLPWRFEFMDVLPNPESEIQ